MTGKLSTLGLLLILTVLILSGCGPGLTQPTELSTPPPTEPAAEPLTVIPATTPTVAVEPSDVQAARDAALTYIVQHHAEQAPSLSLTWAEEFTSEEPFHLPNYQYTTDDWVVTISYRTLPVVYQVVVANQASGFRWEGTVDLLGQVTEQLSLDDVRAARDAALAHLIEHYGEESPAPDLTWAEGRSIPEVWSGAGTYQYTASDWVIVAYYPMMPPQTVVYLVIVANATTGFHGEGQVDAEGGVREVVDDVLVARNAALAYLGERYGDQAPAPALTWREDFIGVPVPEGPWGAGTLQYTYTAKGWAIYVSYQFLAPRPVVYEVVVANGATSFHWEGEVDAAGRVTEKVAPK